MMLQMEASQNARIEVLRKNLLKYTDELYCENNSMFEQHIENMAREKLAPAAFGPVMLTTLGRVYQLQAKRSRWNMGAYFKCAPALSLPCYPLLKLVPQSKPSGLARTV
jgi:hypothetical protein